MNWHHYGCWLCTTAIAMSLSCTNSPTDTKGLLSSKDASLSATTDKDVYSVGEAVTVKISNSSESTAFLLSCGSSLARSFDVKADTSWVRNGGVCPAAALIWPLPLNPGSSLADAMIVSDPGTYRLVFGFGWRETIPLRYTLYSNEFAVKRDRDSGLRPPITAEP